jgi:immune inhibitor A
MPLLLAILASCTGLSTAEVPSTTAPLSISTVSPTLVAPSSLDPTSTTSQENRTAPILSNVATSLKDAPERDLYQLAAALTPGGNFETPQVVNPNPVSYSVGRQDTFWLVDFQALNFYQRSFKLQLVSPQAYWYVEEGQNIQQSDLERSAEIFENDIYPLVTTAFGKENKPGIDNDPHLNILHASLRNVGGYFSSADEYPQAINQYSNERETIYLNTGALALRVGTSKYLSTLAHELQHAIHWAGDPGEDTWVNEGLSELAITIAGYQPDSIDQFLSRPTTSLVHWPLEQLNAAPSYGAASLFMHYLSEHYGGYRYLRRLVVEPSDGIHGIDAYLNALGYEATFRDVLQDWVVANVLDENQGIYGYEGLDINAIPQQSMDSFSEFSSEIPQYAAEYIELIDLVGPLRLHFRGMAENVLIPVEVGEQGCWWSNAGDSISSTLTRAVDLRQVSRATLNYKIWYSIEEDWDYGYVEVSVDGGFTWDILDTPHTSPENPLGQGFGSGYTGESGGWINESIDLTPYAGQDILTRFHYVTDDAINGDGICIREIAVPEADLMNDINAWQSDGFLLTNNRLKQDYIVQVIEKGERNRLTPIPLDSTNSGDVVISHLQGQDRVVVAVVALAPKTRQPASYILTIDPE